MKKFFKKFVQIYIDIFNFCRESYKEFIIAVSVVLLFGSPICLIYFSGWFLLLYIIFIPITAILIDMAERW